MIASEWWSQLALGCFTLDMMGRVLLWNRKMTELMDISETTTCGMEIEHYFQASNSWPTLMQACIETKQTQHFWITSHQDAKKSALKRPALLTLTTDKGVPVFLVQIQECALEQVSQFFENLPDAFLICADGKVILANQRCLTMLHRSQDQLIGQPLAEILELPPCSLVDGQPAKIFQVDFILNENETSALEVLTGPISLCNENLFFYQIRCLKTRHAENERRGAEEACYRHFFHYSQAVALLVDPITEQLVDANEAAARFYGYSQAQLRKMKISDLNKMPKKELQLLMARVLNQQTNFIEVIHTLASGKTVAVQVQTGPIHFGNRTLLLSIITDISEQRKFQRTLAHSERKYSAILNLSAQGFALLNHENIILEVNPALCQMMGRSGEDLFGVPLKALVAEEQIEEVEQYLDQMQSDSGIEIGLWNGRRYKRQYLMTAGKLETDDGVKGRFVFFTDITELRKAEAQAILAARVFETSSEAMFISDKENRIIAVNPAFTSITGYLASDVIGSNPSVLSSSRHDATFYSKMWETILSEGSWQGEIWNRRKNGEIYPEWLSISVLRSQKGERTGFVAVFSDITRRKEIEEEIRHRANHDHLTNLPNRLLFLDRLEESIKQARRKSSKLALLFIDLDRFKWVNDTMGHLAGDQLLVEVSRRLLHCTRESDSIARLAGDEFTILLNELLNQLSAEMVAEKVLQSLSSPFRIQGRDFIISASIGIAIYPDDAHTSHDLLEKADRAMYMSKEQGRNRFCFYKSEMNQAVIKRLRLERDLRFALRRNEFHLVYQPLFDAKTMRLRGAEALLRWHMPNGEVLLPEVFLSLAEETGLIVPIGNWVLQKVCEQAAAWREAGVGLHFSINLSPRQCVESNFILQVSQAFKDWQVEPSSIVFEFNESLLMHDMERGKAWLRELSELGSPIALDDFGSGLSAIGYLSALPLQYLKIDSAVIALIQATKPVGGLARSLVSLSKNLNLIAIAEGVETQEQLQQLQNWDCDLVQGRYLSPPLPLEEFEQLLQRSKSEMPHADQALFISPEEKIQAD